MRTIKAFAFLSLFFICSVGAMETKQEPKKINPKAGRLLTAIDDAPPSVLHSLIADIGDLDAPGEDKEGRSALHKASQLGRVVPVILLLASRANVNNVDSFGTTPLMIAASRGHTFVVEQLLKDNADVAAVRNNEATALIYAVGNNQPVIVTMLLAAGADLNERMENGLTPLNTAALFHHDDIEQLLLAAKAQPEQSPTLWDDACTEIKRLVGYDEKKE